MKRKVYLQQTAQVLAAQLNLIQVLLMLPFDVIRHSILGHLSLTDKHNFRTLCKQACKLMGELAQKLHIAIKPCTNFTRLASWSKQFTNIKSIHLIFDNTQPDQAVSSSFVHYLFTVRDTLRPVTTVQYEGCLPFTFAYPLSTVCPLLTHMEFTGNCDGTEVFAPLSSLTSLVIQNQSTTRNHVSVLVVSAFSLPNLAYLTLKIPSVPSVSLSQLALHNNSVLQSSQVSTLCIPHMILCSSTAESLALLPNLRVLHILALASTDSPGSYAKLSQLEEVVANSVYPGGLLALLPQPSLRLIAAQSFVIDETLESAGSRSTGRALQMLQPLLQPGCAPEIHICAAPEDRLTTSLDGWPVMLGWRVCGFEPVAATSVNFLQKLCSKLPDLRTVGVYSWEREVPVPLSMLRNILHCWQQLDVLDTRHFQALTVTSLLGLAASLGSRRVRMLVNRQLWELCQKEDVNSMLSALHVQSCVEVVQDY